MVVKDEIAGERGAAPLEVVVVQGAAHLEPRSGSHPRRVAAGVALGEIRAGGAAIVGVEVDVRDEATLGVDLGEIEGFNYVGIRRVRCPREPADVLEYQPIPRGGE